VDLGTTFVAAAVTRGDGVEMFPLGDGAMVTPAAVYLREDGLLATGDAAARRAISHPDRVAVEIKRRLGNPTPLMLGGAPYAVTSLLGALLEDVLARVAEIEGGKPDVVALTHPANWGPYRRELFEEVPRSAGLEEPVYATEPEAAAAHYLTTRQLAEGELVAVYDLGGGTFDATVLRRSRGGFEILGTPEGIERLGGADFDEAILAHVNYVGRDALGDLDLSDARTVVALARLRQDCTLAKEALSVDVETTIPVFLPGRQFEVTLRRADFEEMIRAQVESTIGALDRVLRAARVQAGELSAVLLVGGSSRIPLVGRMVAEEFGRPTVVGAHPKHAVALGAAVLAGTRATGRPPAPIPAPAPAAEDTAPVPAPATAASATSAGTIPAEAPPAAPPAPPSGGERSGPRHAEGPRPDDGGPPAGPPRDGAPPSGPAGAPPRRSRRWPVVLGALLAVLAVGAGVAVYLTTRSSGTASSAAPSPSAGPAGPTPAPAPLPTQAPLATSVPVPSTGGVISVGATPDFVAVSPSGRQLYVASPGEGAVKVVDTSAQQVTATIAIPAGPPRFVAFSPDGKTAYVSVWDDARTIAAVAVLDTTSNTVAATIPVDTRPFLAAVTPDGTRLYVPNHDSGTVSVIDTRTRKLLTKFSVPRNPHYVAFSADGSRAYLANHESNLVSVVDTSSNTVVNRIPVGTSPHSLAVNPKRSLVAVGDYDSGDVRFIDTGTNAVVGTVPVGKNPQNVAWAADGRFLYVVDNGDNTLDVVSPDDFTVKAHLPTGVSPTSMAVLPDGRTGYVSNSKSGSLTVLNLAG
jgi:YVTN family beta-propeller protein